MNVFNKSIPINLAVSANRSYKYKYLTLHAFQTTITRQTYWMVFKTYFPDMAFLGPSKWVSQYTIADRNHWKNQAMMWDGKKFVTKEAARDPIKYFSSSSLFLFSLFSFFRVSMNHSIVSSIFFFRNREKSTYV